jgi:hypothetical protein
VPESKFYKKDGKTVPITPKKGGERRHVLSESTKRVMKATWTLANGQDSVTDKFYAGPDKDGHFVPPDKRDLDEIRGALSDLEAEGVDVSSAESEYDAMDVSIKKHNFAEAKKHAGNARSAAQVITGNALTDEMPAQEAK